MKIRIEAAVLLTLLLTSIAGNVWQCAKAKRFEEHDSQFIHIPQNNFRSMTDKEPVLGLSLEEVDAIVQNVARETKDASEQRILSVEKHGHDNVLVRTGSIPGPFSGHGQIFQFSRINKEWVLERGTNTTWWN